MADIGTNYDNLKQDGYSATKSYPKDFQTVDFLIWQEKMAM